MLTIVSLSSREHSAGTAALRPLCRSADYTNNPLKFQATLESLLLCDYRCTMKGRVFALRGGSRKGRRGVLLSAARGPAAVRDHRRGEDAWHVPQPLSVHSQRACKRRSSAIGTRGRRVPHAAAWPSRRGQWPFWLMPACPLWAHPATAAWPSRAGCTPRSAAAPSASWAPRSTTGEQSAVWVPCQCPDTPAAKPATMGQDGRPLCGWPPAGQGPGPPCAC